jgi:O-antigen ligase
MNQTKILKSRFPDKLILYLFFAINLSYFISLFLLQLFVGIFFILWLIDYTKEKLKTIDLFFILIILLGIIRIISIFLSDYPNSSYQAFYKEALFYFGFFAFTFYIRRFSEDDINSIFLSIIIGSIIFSIIGIYRFSIGDVDRAQTYTSGYMIFSTYLLAVFPFSFLIKYKFIKKNEILYTSIIAALILSGIIASLGRTNIAIGIIILLSALIFKKISIKQFILIGVISIAISFMVYKISESKTVEARINTITNTSDRDVIYKGAFELITKKPFFGFGPRTFKDVFPFSNELIDKGVGNWHNDLLNIYMESGLFALLLYLLLFSSLLFILIKMLRLNNSIVKNNIIWGIIFSVCATLVSSLTSGNIFNPTFSIYFVLIISVTSAFYNKPLFTNKS